MQREPKVLRPRFPNAGGGRVCGGEGEGKLAKDRDVLFKRETDRQRRAKRARHRLRQRNSHRQKERERETDRQRQRRR